MRARTTRRSIPTTLPENQGLRLDYNEGMCKGSLEILNRTVMVATNPLHTGDEIEAMIHNIDQAARVALENAALDDVELQAPAGGRSAEVRRVNFSLHSDYDFWPYRY